MKKKQALKCETSGFEFTNKIGEVMYALREDDGAGPYVTLRTAEFANKIGEVMYALREDDGAGPYVTLRTAEFTFESCEEVDFFAEKVKELLKE